jgi:hypothetical protein
MNQNGASSGINSRTMLPFDRRRERAGASSHAACWFSSYIISVFKPMRIPPDWQAGETFAG